jgi:hypothetical protein
MGVVVCTHENASDLVARINIETLENQTETISDG